MDHVEIDIGSRPPVIRCHFVRLNGDDLVVGPVDWSIELDTTDDTVRARAEMVRLVELETGYKLPADCALIWTRGVEAMLRARHPS